MYKYHAILFGLVLCLILTIGKCELEEAAELVEIEDTDEAEFVEAEHHKANDETPIDTIPPSAKSDKVSAPLEPVIAPPKRTIRFAPPPRPIPAINDKAPLENISNPKLIDSKVAAIELNLKKSDGNSKNDDKGKVDSSSPGPGLDLARGFEGERLPPPQPKGFGPAGGEIQPIEGAIIDPYAPGPHNGWGYYNEFNYPSRLDRPRAYAVNSGDIIRDLGKPTMSLLAILFLLFM